MKTNPHPYGLRVSRPLASMPLVPGNTQQNCSVAAESIRTIAATVASRRTLLTRACFAGRCDQGVGGDTHKLRPLPGENRRADGEAQFGLRWFDGRAVGRSFSRPILLRRKNTAQLNHQPGTVTPWGKPHS